MFIVYPGYNYLPIFRNIDNEEEEAFCRGYRSEINSSCEEESSEAFYDIFKEADDEYVRSSTSNINGSII